MTDAEKLAVIEKLCAAPRKHNSRTAWEVLAICRDEPVPDSFDLPPRIRMQP